jgi:hypothetical protein
MLQKLDWPIITMGSMHNEKNNNCDIFDKTNCVKFSPMAPARLSLWQNELKLNVRLLYFGMLQHGKNWN